LPSCLTNIYRRNPFDKLKPDQPAIRIVGEGIYDGIVADGGSGPDDGGGDTGPEGWVVLVDDCGGGYAGRGIDGGGELG
jgi:hypothetical protein